MKTIQKIENNEAWNRYVRIKQLKQRSEEMLLVMGAELYEFSTKKQYQSLGYDTFEAFLGDPEIDIVPRTAYRMIRIYKIFILEYAASLQLDIQDNYIEALIDKDPDYVRLLTDTGVSKLDKIASYITDNNRFALLNTASTTSRTDLDIHLNDKANNYLPQWQRQVDECIEASRRIFKNESTPVEIQSLAREYTVKLIQFRETFSA